MIGKEGVSPAVVASAREAIKKRELIKVRVLQNAPEEPADAITMLAERADANRSGERQERAPVQTKL